MDLTKITTPFGLLDAETQRALKDCGGPWEFWQGADMWSAIEEPSWNDGLVYRQKPQTLTQDTIPWAQIDKHDTWPGMSLSDEAALAALQGICAHNGSYGYKNGPSEIAGRAWEIADAFIAAREAKTDGA